MEQMKDYSLFKLGQYQLITCKLQYDKGLVKHT